MISKFHLYIIMNLKSFIQIVQFKCNSKNFTYYFTKQEPDSNVKKNNRLFGYVFKMYFYFYFER